jgi:hypothetical protein
VFVAGADWSARGNAWRRPSLNADRPRHESGFSKRYGVREDLPYFWVNKLRAIGVIIIV